jgi:hypothetical protein
MKFGYISINSPGDYWRNITLDSPSFDSNSEILTFNFLGQPVNLQRVGFEALQVNRVLEGALFFIQGNRGIAVVLEESDVNTGGVITQAEDWDKFDTPTTVQAPAPVEKIVEVPVETIVEKTSIPWVLIFVAAGIGVVLGTEYEQHREKKHQKGKAQTV